MTPKRSADLASRLVREPFLPFAVETTDGEIHEIRKRWQLIVSETAIALGAGSTSPGIVDAIHVLPLDAVARVIDLETPGSKTVAIPTADGVLKLYTDGACQGNPGPGGWGFIIKDGTGAEIGRGSGGERPTTNNRMELLSVIRGLEALDPTQSVKLITDSQYVAKGLSEWMKGWKQRGWKRKTAKGLEPVANEDLWRTLDQLTATRKVVCEWVRGHAGHPENEECDRMAVEAAAEV